MNKTVNVKEIIRKDQAILLDDGDKVYAAVDSEFKNNNNAKLDFRGITLVASCFLNKVISPLYEKYGDEYVRGHLSIANVSDSDILIFKQVIERAKDYHQNKDVSIKAIEGVLDADE